MQLKSSSILSLVLLASSACAYRILGIFPFLSKSHYHLGGALMRGLAEAGHDVTVFTLFPDSRIPKNGTWRVIVAEELPRKQQEDFEDLKKGYQIEVEALKILLLPHYFRRMGIRLTEAALAEPSMQELIKSGEKFDVVIVSQLLVEAMKALAAHFDAHLVLFDIYKPSAMTNYLMGNLMLPSFLPDIILAYTGDMSFMQRVTNTVFTMIELFHHVSVIYPSHRELVRRYISKDLDLYDAQYNVSLLLSNSHESLTHPQPLVPSMKKIGGFHVEPPKKLPKNLQKYLDDAKDGAILFSMGSNLKSAVISEPIKEAFLKAFSKRKERILMKWDDDVLLGSPQNVMISKWLPQTDILAHPNLRLFITHGGFLSITETVYHGVPIIALPVFGDQFHNARTAEHGGYAIALNIRYLTEEDISAALEEILSNPKYTENVKKRSKIFHDRPRSPLEDAIYWIEYVVRHNGAEHLRVSHTQMPWYQFFLLDVFAFFIVILLAFYLILRMIYEKTIGKIFRREKLKRQ